MPKITPLSSDERVAIQKWRWFATLPATVRHDLLRLAQVDRFADGEFVTARGALRAPWFACAAGTIRVSTAARNGKAFTLAYVRAGVWFGGPGVFDGGTSTHDLYAVGDTTVLRVGRAEMQALLAESPALCQAVLKLQARHVRDLYTVVEAFNSQKLGPRLARQLMTLARAYGVADTRGARSNAVRIELSISQTRLAEMVGYSRQRVNAELKRLEREDIVALGRAGIVLLDPTRCQKLAEA